MSDHTDPADPKDPAVSTADATADTGELAPVPAVVDGKKAKRLRAPWVTVGGAVVVLLILAVLGYVWGLGPLNRLNTERGITPPA
jgi:hypothetical protein